MKQYLKQLTHNLICHPLMGIFPCKIMDRLHDWNAKWAFKE